MVAVTNAYTTASAVGIREDLSDSIYRVDVDDTPFQSRIGSTKAKNTLHEWQTRILGSVDVTNAQLEGDTTPRAPSTPNVRRSNVCQISMKNATTSGTLEAVDKAGRDQEMALQMADRAIELRKDMEAIMLSNQAFANSTTRLLRGFEASIRTNTVRGVGGLDPADPSVTPGTQATDGTQAAFTEAMLLTALQAVFNAGGNVKFALMGSSAKKVASTFTGRASAREMIGAKVISQGTTKYACDFGDIDFQIHRYLRGAGRTVYLIDPENVAVSYLRKMVRFPLSKIGDAETRVILSEYTLEMRNERAHAVVADLTTP